MISEICKYWKLSQKSKFYTAKRVTSWCESHFHQTAFTGLCGSYSCSVCENWILICCSRAWHSERFFEKEKKMTRESNEWNQFLWIRIRRINSLTKYRIWYLKHTDEILIGKINLVITYKILWCGYLLMWKLHTRINYFLKFSIFELRTAMARELERL